MIAMRDTIAAPDQARFDSVIDRPQDGNTMTSYNLNDGTVQIRVVRSKTLEVLAVDTFADSGLATEFIVELKDAVEQVQKSRANVIEMGINGTPEPETDVVV
jgi:L-fucose mutarotase/ribose pyranase (RbsD/FucU family)